MVLLAYHSQHFYPGGCHFIILNTRIRISLYMRNSVNISMNHSPNRYLIGFWKMKYWVIFYSFLFLWICCCVLLFYCDSFNEILFMFFLSGNLWCYHASSLLILFFFSSENCGIFFLLFSVFPSLSAVKIFKMSYKTVVRQNKSPSGSIVDHSKGFLMC